MNATQLHQICVFACDYGAHINNQISSRVQSGMTIKILIADDHIYLAEGVQGALEGYSDIEVVGKVQSLQNLEQAIEKTTPDVIMLDIMFGEERTGISFAESYLKDHPNMKIVIFSQYDDEKIVKSSFDAGARAFLKKNVSPEILYEALTEVNKGNTYIPADIAQTLAQSYINKKRDTVSPLETLTEREYNVFLEAAKGLTHGEIAKVLSLSPRTVAAEFSKCKDKLKIERPAEFTRLAMKFKLID